MTTILSQCFNCKRYDRYDNEKHSCKAFPKGIPEKVFDNTIIHDHKLNGQTGDYIFESNEPKKTHEFIPIKDTEVENWN